MNQSLFSALWLEKMAIGITIGLIVMVAALNIVATLILMVMEKHKDIAILVSMGASRGAITAHLHAAGHGHRRRRARPRARVLGWGACHVLDHYKLHPGAGRRLPDLLRALHPAAERRRDRGRGGACSSASWPRSIPRAAPPASIPPKPCATNDATIR